MVCATVKPSLRAASCCKVEVVNGAAGVFFSGRVVMSLMVNVAVTALQQFPGFCLCLKPVRQFGFHFHCFAVSVRNEEYGGNTVGCFGLECMYLAFALYNETDGYGLYTACRKGRFHFLPQYR